LFEKMLFRREEVGIPNCSRPTNSPRPLWAVLPASVLLEIRTTG
jgi:hypothetical protein